MWPKCVTVRKCVTMPSFHSQLSCDDWLGFNDITMNKNESEEFGEIN